MFFDCFNFVVLWVTVMGPKPARIKGNSLFYPFSCESKASAEVQQFIVCLYCFYCLSHFFLIANINTILRHKMNKIDKKSKMGTDRPTNGRTKQGVESRACD